MHIKMDHFLEKNDSYTLGNLNEKSNKYKSSHHSRKCSIKALDKCKTSMNICWNQLKLNEVNDWDNVQKITDLYQWKLQPLIQVLCKWQPNSQHLQNYYKDQPCLTMLVQTCCKTIPVLKIDWKVWKLNHLFGTLVIL